MKLLQRLAFLLAAALPAVRPVAAQPADENNFRYGIGAAFLTERDGYRSVKAESRLIPGIYAENQYFRLFGPQLDINVWQTEKLRLGARLEYRFDGYEAQDGPYLAGMRDRKAGLFSGLQVSYEFGSVEFEAEWIRSLSSERGSIGGAYIKRPFRFAKASISPRIGLEYASARYVNYYHGVRDDEVRPDRPAYRPGSTVNTEAGIDISYRLTQQQIVFAVLNYELFGRDIKNSPLMDRRGTPQLNIGYLYRFK